MAEMTLHNISELPEKQSSLDDEENPFKLPTDEEIFFVRGREREEAKEAKRRFNEQKVWEKGVKKPTSSRSSALYLGNKGQPASHRNGLNQQAHLLGERRREKENTTEFIAKKREMFLVQMSLDTKKEEIRKLEQKAKLKEEALRKSELMLESDAIRFDKFLKENDRNAHEAIKHHDEESKAKQEKVAEIKKLNHEIAKVQSEMSKYSEQLDDCLKYKEFLDKLTPASEKEALEQKKQERLEQRRLRSEAKRAARLKRMEGAAQEAEAADETNGDQQEQEHSETALAEAVEDGEQSGDEEEEDFEPIYFTKPQQLIDIFSALEERNLFLIQNSQETEEALEELKKKYEDTKVKTEQKTSALTKNIEELRSKIAVENEKAARLEKRVSSNIGVGKQEQMLHELGQKVTQVCMRCGLNPDSNPDTLDKLAQIERKLEYLIKEMSLLPQDYVRAAEKKKEADRRDRVRKEKVLEKQRAYEERLAKSVARATAAIPQRTGKKIMFRSPPFKRRQKTRANDDKSKVDEEQKYRKFFT